MLTLVIDTATEACSVALVRANNVIASHNETIGRGHAERLLPMIADLPLSGKAEQVVVNVGPGSFTGIRVGVAAARALGLAWRVPVSGYACLDLVAAMARSQFGRAEAIDVAMIGGHGEYFFERFDSRGLSIDGMTALSPTAAVQKSSASTVAGNAAADLVVRRGSGAAFDVLPDAARWHLISALPTHPPTPIYGRSPDAIPLKVETR